MSHRVVWISYSRFFFFCSLTELTWCELPGWYRSMIVMVFLVPELERRSRSPMLYLKLNVLSCHGCFWRHLCSEMDKVESRCSCSAPFPDFGLFISMIKNSRRNIRLCCLSLQSSGLLPTLDALSMHVRRRANYQAAIWRRALHPGSSLPGPHGYGWLCKPECGDDPTCHSSIEIQWMTRPAA